MKTKRWRRILLTLTACVLVAVGIGVTGVLVLLHSSRVHAYLLRTAEERVSGALGGHMRMREFALHPSIWGPSADLYDVVIDGAAPYVTPPLLQVDHLRIGIRVTSLVHRQWTLSEIVMDHPVAHIFVDPSGKTNLPVGQPGNRTSVFDLGARHVTLNASELYYNDRKSVIDADLHDLAFLASFDPGPKRYSGEVRYHDGRVQLEGIKPVLHSLEAQFEATPDEFRLTHSTLTSGTSQLALAGVLDDYANPRIQATYQSSLNTVELADLLNEASVPAGVVHVDGSGQYQNELSLDGHFSSDLLRVNTETLHTLVSNVRAGFTLAKGNLDLHEVQANVLGGAVSGSLSVRDVRSAQDTELHAVLNSVALAGIQGLLNPRSMQQVRLTGTGSGSVEAKWHKNIDTLTAHTDFKVTGAVAPPKGTAPMPVDGEIHADYSASAKQLSLNRTSLQSPQTTINLNGTASDHSAMQVQFQSNDLHEVELLATAFGATTQPLGLYGTASFNGTVQGSTADPQIAGQLSAPTLSLRGTEWHSLAAGLEANASHLKLSNGEVRPANNGGRILFSSVVGLEHWAFANSNPLQVDLDASEINVTDLKNLAEIQAPITGILSTKISMHGSVLNPMGQGTINLSQATLGEESVQSVNVSFSGSNHEIHAQLGLKMSAGSVQGTGTYFPSERRYDVQLDARGLQLNQVQSLIKRNLQVAGVLNISAKGAGTLGDPAFQFTAEVPQLQIRDQALSGVRLQASVANHVADLTLASEAMSAKVSGHGRVNLNAPYYADLVLDTLPMSLRPVLATYLPVQSDKIDGQTEIHATLRGPLKDPALIDAHITIPTLTLAYADKLKLAASGPIVLNYTRNLLTLEKTSFRGTGTDLTVQGIIPTNGSAPVALTAIGTVDLSLAQLMDPDITSSGQLQFNITSASQGQIKVVNANLGGDSLPLGLQNGNGVLNLTSDRLEIAQFAATVGSGNFTAKGGIIYKPAVQFNLSIAGSGVRMLYPQGVRESVDTNLTMTGSLQSALLRGQVRLTDVSFSPTFDLADVIGQFETPSALPPEGFARNLQLDIGVQSTNEANLASSKLSVDGSANLRVRGTAAEPIVLGRINLNGGDLVFRGNRYVLQASTLDFTNPYKIEPQVNLAVDTNVQQYNIHLLFRGTVDRLRTTYSSDPALPPSDIINLLVFGKTSEATAANPTPGGLGAESLIASSVSGQLTSKIENVAGLSQFSVDPILGGNQQSPGARVTIQQRVTGNLFVTFSADPTSTQREVVKLEYQATPRVSLSGVRDQNGGFALDIRLRKTW